MPFYTTTLSPGDFLPLFQLMDDYHDTRSSTRPNESAARPKSATNHPTNTRPTPQLSFTPKFDVREGNDLYVLDGELPGARQDDIEIEFTDPETMVIRGRVERNYHNVTSSSPAHDDDDLMGDDDDASSTKSNYHSPTVEDEDENTGASTRSVVVPKQSTPAAATAPATEAFTFWASERQIGNFERKFSFPSRINQDGVRATLKNGILSVTVPKEAIKKTKRIRID